MIKVGYAVGLEWVRAVNGSTDFSLSSAGLNAYSYGKLILTSYYI